MQLEALIEALKRLRATRAPNYPLPGFEPVAPADIDSFLASLEHSSPEMLPAILDSIESRTPPITFSDDDLRDDQLRYHYAVTKVREAVASARSIQNDQTSASLFIKPDEFADELDTIRKGIEVVQASLDQVRGEIRSSSRSGVSINFGPVGIPLEAVSSAATLASNALLNAAGIDAISLTLHLQSMSRNSGIAYRNAQSLNGAPPTVVLLLKVLAERATATAEVGLGVLRRAFEAIDTAREVANPATAVRVAKSLRLLSEAVAVDFGTSELRLVAKGKGLVGKSATAPRVRGADISRAEWLRSARWADRPILHGVVADPVVAEDILRRAVRDARVGGFLSKPKVLVAVPSGSTAVERRAMGRVISKAALGKAVFVDAPIAAAIGAGINTSGVEACMVGDVGAGKTDVAVIALNGVVYNRTVRVGGDDMTQNIATHILRRWNLALPIDECEKLKLQIASASLDGANQDKIEILGSDARTKRRVSIKLSGRDISEAITESVSSIIEAFKVAIEATPAELAHDIQRRGVMLTGGGAMLDGLARELRDHLGLPVSIAIDPDQAVVRGLSAIFDDPQHARTLDALRF